MNFRPICQKYIYWLNKEISELHQIMVENYNLTMEKDKIINFIYSLIQKIKDDSWKFKKMDYETWIKILLIKYILF